MKKILILMILFSFKANAQKVENSQALGWIGTATLSSGNPIIIGLGSLSDTTKKPHVHLFPWVLLPQCYMGNGAYCAVAHGTYSDCACGRKATIANIFAGMEIIDATYKNKN